jgi:Bacterial toxin 33
MSTIQRLVGCAALVLSLLVLLPASASAQEEGRPAADHDPRRGVDSDDKRGRDDERRATEIETRGRWQDLTKRQNSETHDIQTLQSETAADDAKKTDQQINDRKANGAPDHPSDLESLKDTRKLSPSEVATLEKRGADVHALKGEDSTLDLYKDKDGNVYTGNKDGSGAGEATGYSLK